MRKSRVILIILFALILFIPIIPPVKSTGYGEENENLGQFTDDFINDDNVSVAVNVINNQTLDCMELNYSEAAGDIYEDLTDWVEDDGPGDLTVIPSTCTFTTMRRDSDSLIYLDAGAGNIDDFNIDFTLQITDLEAGDISNIIQMWAFVVGNGNNRVDLTAGEGIWVALQQLGSTDDRFRYRLRQREAGAWSVDILDATVYGLVTHYLTFIRTGTNITLNVYSDEARTILIEHLTDANGESTNYRYHIATVGYDVAGDPNDHVSGNVRNISLGLGLGGYFSDGYFITEDYLNYTTGNSLTLLTNTTIPDGTTLTVQLSNDNSTWILNDWDPIFGGFEAIDLRILNYTDLYLMYNFTGTPTLTPRIYQSRLITTLGNVTIIEQNITGEWLYYNLTSINVNVGTHDAGNLASTFVVDGDTYDISETVGVPAWVISFNWTNVDQNANSMWIVLYAFYSGNLKHDIDLQLYNFTSTAWADITLISDMAGFEWTNASIYDLRIPNDFINSTGAVLGRIIHIDAGNINHDILIDLLRLHIFVPFEQTCPPTPTDGAADTIWIIFLAIGLIFMLSIAFLYPKNK